VDYISSIDIGSGTLQLGVENLFNSQYFPVVSQLQSTDAAYAAARGRTLSLRYSINW
jgi:iron complex outermembrane receptor protein